MTTQNRYSFVSKRAKTYGLSKFSFKIYPHADFESGHFIVMHRQMQTLSKDNEINISFEY